MPLRCTRWRVYCALWRRLYRWEVADAAQALESGFSVHMPLTPQHPGGGGPREGAKGAVNLHQQVDVLSSEALRPGVRRDHVALAQCFTCQDARYESADLGASVAASALQIAQHHRAVLATQARIAQPIKGARNVGVTRLRVRRRYQLQSLGALKKLAHLGQSCEF